MKVESSHPSRSPMVWIVSLYYGLSLKMVITGLCLFLNCVFCKDQYRRLFGIELDPTCG
jgi:hypothetical protein